MDPYEQGRSGQPLSVPGGYREPTTVERMEYDRGSADARAAALEPVHEAGANFGAAFREAPVQTTLAALVGAPLVVGLAVAATFRLWAFLSRRRSGS